MPHQRAISNGLLETHRTVSRSFLPRSRHVALHFSVFRVERRQLHLVALRCHVRLGLGDPKRLGFSGFLARQGQRPLRGCSCLPTPRPRTLLEPAHHNLVRARKKHPSNGCLRSPQHAFQVSCGNGGLTLPSSHRLRYRLLCLPPPRLLQCLPPPHSPACVYRTSKRRVSSSNRCRASVVSVRARVAS